MAGRRGERVTVRQWLRAARRPAMVLALVGLLAAATVCGVLGRWQLGRAQERAQSVAQHKIDDANRAGPVAIDDLMTAQRSLSADAVGRTVSAHGSYEADGQLLVTGRQLDGRDGFLVLTPLRTSGGAVLPVVRGWVSAPGDAAAPPSGERDVIGVIAPSEAASLAGPQEGRVGEISSAELVGVWGGPIYPGYLVAAQSDAGGIETLPAPQSQPSGWNLQNLFYAVEWWVFGAFALVLWWRLVRDRARDAERVREPVPTGATSMSGAD